MSFGSQTPETSSNKIDDVQSKHRIHTFRARVPKVHFFRKFLTIPPTLRLSMACFATHEALNFTINQFTFDVTFSVFLCHLQMP